MYKADSVFGASLSDHTLMGYHFWGKPLAKAMRKYKTLTVIVRPFAMSWAKTMAGEPTLFGRAALLIGIPVCAYLGRCLSGGITQKQIRSFK
jgi:hypothetical protein